MILVSLIRVGIVRVLFSGGGGGKIISLYKTRFDYGT